MRKLFLLAAVLVFASSLAFAADQAAAPAADQVTLTGIVIDNQCAAAQKPDMLAEFVRMHPKSCALKCAASGYSIFTDGKFIKFDGASNAKVEEFLKKGDSKTTVVVAANKVGDELSLVSIENQK